MALIILGYVDGIPSPARYHRLMRGNTQASSFPGVSLRISPSSQRPHQSSADASSQDADDPCSSTTQDRVYIRIARVPCWKSPPPAPRVVGVVPSVGLLIWLQYPLLKLVSSTSSVSGLKIVPVVNSLLWDTQQNCSNSSTWGGRDPSLRCAQCTPPPNLKMSSMGPDNPLWMTAC